MNKYVSPIMELEKIDIEDILMSNEETEPTDPSMPDPGGNGLPPLDLTSASTFFD